jgi:hypothetical protein
MVSHGMVSPDWKPLVVLLERVLDGLLADLADQDPIGVSVTAGHRAAGDGYGLVHLAAVGEVADWVETQVELREGPIPAAVATAVPVTTADLWTDPRWPGLTRGALSARASDPAGAWRRIRGAAAVPVDWGDGGVLALSCCLARPADETTLSHLRRYEDLAAATLGVVHASTVDGPDQVLGMLQTRAVIEQAKGALIAATRCDADTAWGRLRVASQALNVKVRDLAIALIEHLGDAPAEQPAELPGHEPNIVSRAGIAQLWSILIDQPPAAR